MRILILIFFLILAIIGCFKIKTPVIYLIPYGYQGKILVIYGQERGRKEEFDGKRRLYRIDTSGILITNFKSEDGILDEVYYYLKPDGSRERINIDSSILEQDSVKAKKYLTKNYNTILVRYYGVSGGYGGAPDFPKSVSYTESIIASGRFCDSTDLEKFEDRQWQIVVKKLK